MFPLSSPLVTFLASVPPPAPERDGAFGFEFFLVMIIMIVAFIFLIQRPQAKERERRAKAIEGMKKGDKVISIGGIHGVVSKLSKDKDTVIVEVAKGVEMEFNKGAVSVQAPPADEKDKGKQQGKKGK